ncbi:translation elongation factor Ts [Gammaproteobacteria bacterium AB-CW1]|uniref:Elongation factor Ts n=1 Tax=Natronospira elongata TaxID=3110268 RepID=A0AAP6MJN2_9GAMM|nr:translation elongation factor Ts [Gammaproteobacteria bacterium AB-CW1]
MGISASQVKELRERTGAGMMECKKALTETGGDMEAAIEHMRKAGMAKADKKAGRVAAEGRIVVKSQGGRAVILEVNCETDFVAGGDDFSQFADQVAETILKESPADVPALDQLKLASGETVDEARRALIAKIGENMSVRRFQIVDAGEGQIAQYLHGMKIGVVVAYQGGDEQLGRDLAMHIAASKPMCVSKDEVPAETVEHEKGILKAQAEGSGKPAEIIEKMITGRLNKWLGEITLLGQPFVKDPDTKVEKLLKSQDASVKAFVRFEVGEGIEKQEDNFVEEVMAQAKGS